MNTCHRKDCNEPKHESYGLCVTHWKEHQDKMIKRRLKYKNLRLNDPLYIDDLMLFNKCTDTLISYNEDEDNDEEIIHLYYILFGEYYKRNLSRTELLIQRVKEEHEELCDIDDLEYLSIKLHDYKIYSNFLAKWLEESKVLEKLKLAKELPLINDVNTIIQNIIKKI